MANNSEKLYNVKILRNFWLYLRQQLNWNQDQIDELFQECGSDASIIESDDNWFDQDFSDLFYSKLVQMTGDKDIAYKVGRYTTAEAAQGFGGKIIQGLLSPQVAFKNIQKVTSLYTKGSYYESILVNRGRAIIRSHVAEGCNEKFYQCRNRTGMVEAIPSFFNQTPLKIKHDICYHKGDKFCEYEILWKEPFRYRTMLFTFISGLLAAYTGYLVTPDTTAVVLLATAVSFLTYFVFQRKESEKMGALLRTHNNALSDSINVINRRHEETILVRDIMKATTEMRPINELVQAAADSIKAKMAYDRIIILLVDQDNGTLEVNATAGYQGDLKDLVEQAEFRIREDNSSGFFINVVNSKKSIFVKDAKKQIHKLSSRSRTLVKMLGTEAFIAVPILFEDEVLGVLAVENETLDNPLTNNDLELLESVADHLSVSITNSISYEKTKESLQLAEKMKNQEKQTRELFQKYVPNELLGQHNHLNNSFIQVKQDIFSVMFVDIFNYSTFSQNLQSEDVVEILNIYVEEINEVVCQHSGRINKVIGDGLLIYFSGSGENCIVAGEKILAKMATINARLKEKGYSEIEIGIGAHRGECIIGNIGYQERLDYTLIGDTVNTASRVEGYTRMTGPNTMCFTSSFSEFVNEANCSRCGEISLKGLQQPVEIFQLLGENSIQEAS